MDRELRALTPKTERVGAIVLAAGSSSRMNGIDKQLTHLRGLPVFIHSVKVLENSDLVDAICVVFSESNISSGRMEIAEAEPAKFLISVAGGARRQDSVKAGIEALRSAEIEADWLLVHDGARPFIEEAMISRGLDAARQTGAAVAAVALKDTVKQVNGQTVIATPDRSTLRLIQTPQVFEAALLTAAHDAVTEDVTDDASMVERNGGSVTVFEGDYDNIKITTPGDMALAEAIYDRRHGLSGLGPGWRWGTGFDGHALVTGGPLRLGGIEIPFDMKLDGHSDGDVLLHAVASALLGAAGLGDMGSNFPSSDSALAGIDSAELLNRAISLAADAGWELMHLDATIIAQRPRLSGHVAAISARIASATGLEPFAVNIKVTSTDHVGAIGDGKGIAAQAIATVRSISN